MEDEIDLRQYLTTVLKHWKLIIIITAIAAVIALIIALLTPPVYEANSTVVILQGDTNQLLYMARSNIIAEEVSKEANSNFNTTEFTPSGTSNIIKINLQGNLIVFSAQYSDPTKVDFITNQYAQDYTEYANESYSSFSSQSPEEIRIYIDSIKRVYEENAKALVNFEENSNIDTLNQNINDLKLLIDLISFREKISSLSNNWSSEAAIKSAYYNLENRFYSGQTSTTILTSIPAVALDDIQPVTLNVVDGLISTIELQTGTRNGLSKEEIKIKVAALRSQLDEKNLNRANLLSQRDAALSAYQAALIKLTRAEMDKYNTGQYIRIVDKAVIPDYPLSDNKKWLNIIIAVILGFIIAVVAAFVLQYSKKSTKKPENKN